MTNSIAIKTDVAELTVPQMQAIVRENGLEVKGDKRKRVNLEPVVATWQRIQQEAIAMAVDAQAAIVESSAQSVAVADAAETVATIAVDKVVEVLTKPEVVDALKLVLRIVAVTIAFIFFTAFKAGMWCWERREQTAVYHWIQDGMAWLDERMVIPVVEVQ